MKKIPHISEAEWQVMKVIWAQSPVAAKSIVEQLTEKMSWSDKTIKTLISRLVAKKALTFAKNGKEYLYRPLVKEEQCISAETKSFMERIFGGSVKPMLSFFVEHYDLTTNEIEELKCLLKGKGK